MHSPDLKGDKRRPARLPTRAAAGSSIRGVCCDAPAMRFELRDGSDPFQQGLSKWWANTFAHAHATGSAPEQTRETAVGRARCLAALRGRTGRPTLALSEDMWL